MKIVCARKNSLQGLQTEFPFLIKNSIIFLRPKVISFYVAPAMGAGAPIKVDALRQGFEEELCHSSYR